MTSSWKEGDEKLFREELSLLELKLLQHLRSLEYGSHIVVIVKRTRGREGLETFEIKECIPTPK